MFLQAHFEFRSQARKNVIEAWEAMPCVVVRILLRKGGKLPVYAVKPVDGGRESTASKPTASIQTPQEFTPTEAEETPIFTSKTCGSRM